MKQKKEATGKVSKSKYWGNYKWNGNSYGKSSVANTFVIIMGTKEMEKREERIIILVCEAQSGKHT